MILEKLYPYAPVWMQNVGISLYGLSYKRERQGGRFREYVADFLGRDRCSSDQMSAHVEQELRRLISHAFENVPYYRRKWSALGLEPGDLERFTADDLKRLPLTPKADLRADPNAFVARTIPRKRLRRYYSSGSTGTPVTCIYTVEAHRRFVAAREARSFAWAGTTMLDSRSMLGGRLVVPRAHSRAPYHRYNWVEKQVYLSCFHISPERVPYYVEALNRYRPRVLTGYASAHYLLARRMLKQGLRLDYAPDALVLSSEKLTPEMKDWIHRAFGARPYQEYGSVENCALATECELGGLHANPDFGIIEITRDDGTPVSSGEEGRIVCTGLLNEAQPLIRYDIGDEAAWADSRCACGRGQLPMLREIAGRIEDVVVGLDGREMVRFHGVFIGLPHVLEGQIVQENRSLIRVRVVATDGFGESEERAIRERIVRGRVGQIQIAVERVEELERNERGKIRAVISRIPVEERSPAAAAPRKC